MKKILFIAILSSLAWNIQAQDAISKFFSKYENDMDFVHVSMTSRMFGLMSNLELEDPEDQAISDAISKLTGLKILAKEDTDQAKALYQEAFRLIPASEYDELMSVRSEDKNMKFMIKERGGTINELLMVMGGDQEFFILSIVGDIDLEQIAKLSKALDIDGLDNLEQLDKD